MLGWIMRHLMAAAILLAFAGMSPAAFADSGADFYKGKQVKINIGASLGGPNGLYSRLLAAHMKKHLPGNPNIQVIGMGGAGGVKLANYMFTVAAKDGSEIGMPLPGVLVAQILRPKKVKYDAKTFQWIGNIDNTVGVIALRSDAAATTMDGAKAATLRLAASGKGSDTFIVPTMLNSVFGTKFKIVTGYRGYAPMDKAILQKEVDGRAGSWPSWKSRHQDLIQAKKVVFALQYAPGKKRHADLPNVPSVWEMVKKKDAPLFNFLTHGPALSRAYFLPAGVPADRVAAVRKAFIAAITDKAFLAEAAKRNMSVSPSNGAEVQALSDRVFATPADVLEKARKALGFAGK